MHDDLDTIWEEIEDVYPAPPVTAERIREWEQKFGVRLPPLLARMLMIQNGGTVRDTEGLLDIEPLEQFESLLLPHWDHLFSGDLDRDFDTKERIYQIGDPGRVFRIGNHDSSDLLLDYNEGEEPRVLWVDENEIDLDDELCESFDECILRLMGWQD